MAIDFGARKLAGWLNFGGLNVPVERAEVELEGQSKTGRWLAEVPMSYPGVYDVAVGLGSQKNCSIDVSINGAVVPLVTGPANLVTIDYIHTIVRVEGDDGSGDLHVYKSSEQFKNRTNAQVVESLSGRLGLAFKNLGVQSFMAGRKMQQDYVKLFDGVSYGAAIHKLAEADGARWWVKNGSLYYAPQGAGDGSVYSLNYQPPTPETPMRCDCIDLTVRYNIPAGQPQEVTVNAWHSFDKTVHRAVTSRPGIGPTYPHSYQLPQVSQDQAQQHADSKADAFANNALELTAMVVGDPNIDVANMVQLTGTGAWDGQYILKKITHELGWMNGYTTLLRATKNMG